MTRIRLRRTPDAQQQQHDRQSFQEQARRPPFGGNMKTCLLSHGGVRSPGTHGKNASDPSPGSFGTVRNRSCSKQRQSESRAFIDPERKPSRSRVTYMKPSALKIASTSPPFPASSREAILRERFRCALSGHDAARGTAEIPAAATPLRPAPRPKEPPALPDGHTRCAKTNRRRRACPRCASLLAGQAGECLAWSVPHPATAPQRRCWRAAFCPGR